jgi:hypothetical protein
MVTIPAMTMMMMPRLSAGGAGEHGDSQCGCEDTGHLVSPLRIGAPSRFIQLALQA